MCLTNNKEGYDCVQKYNYVPHQNYQNITSILNNQKNVTG